MAQGMWHRVCGTGYILYHVRFTRLSISSALFFRLQDTFGGFSARFSCFSFVFSRFSRFIYYFLWLSSSSSSSFGVFVVARALACVFSSGVRDLGQTEVRLEADAVASCAALRCWAQRRVASTRLASFALPLLAYCSLSLCLAASLTLFLCDKRKIDNGRQLRCLTLTPTALPLPLSTFSCFVKLFCCFYFVLAFFSFCFLSTCTTRARWISCCCLLAYCGF